MDLSARKRNLDMEEFSENQYAILDSLFLTSEEKILDSKEKVFSTILTDASRNRESTKIV